MSLNIFLCIQISETFFTRRIPNWKKKAVKLSAAMRIFVRNFRYQCVYWLQCRNENKKKLTEFSSIVNRPDMENCTRKCRKSHNFSSNLRCGKPSNPDVKSLLRVCSGTADSAGRKRAEKRSGIEMGHRNESARRS